MEEEIYKMFNKKNWLIIKLEKIRVLKNLIKIQMILNRGEIGLWGKFKNKLLLFFYINLSGLQFFLQIRYYKVFQKISHRMLKK